MLAVAIGGVFAMSLDHDAPPTTIVRETTPAPASPAADDPGGRARAGAHRRACRDHDRERSHGRARDDRRHRARGNTPVTLDLVRAEAPVTIELNADGRRTTTTRFLPDHAQTLQIPLARSSRGTASHATEPETRPGFFAFE